MYNILLVCFVSPKIGLGHLSRLLALAQTLKKDKKVIPEFLIFGDLIKKDELNDFKVNNVLVDDNIVLTIENCLKNNNFNGIVLDIYQKHKNNNLYKFIKKLKKKKIFVISIDF